MFTATGYSESYASGQIMVGGHSISVFFTWRHSEHYAEEIQIKIGLSRFWSKNLKGCLCVIRAKTW